MLTLVLVLNHGDKNLTKISTIPNINNYKMKVILENDEDILCPAALNIFLNFYFSYKNKQLHQSY